MSETNTFRPMRRFRQELPEEESIEILKTAPRGFLSVIGDGGYPYAVPINFVYEDGRIYFHCAKEGHKLDAVRACDKACFTVIDTPVKEPGDWTLGGKYFPQGYDIERDMQQNAPRAEILEFTIEHLSGKRVREK